MNSKKFKTIPTLRRNFDKLRLVFLISILFCMLLLLYHYHLSITFLFSTMNDTKHVEITSIPTNFSLNFNETIGSTNQNNVTNGEGNSREKAYKVELFTKIPKENLDPCKGQYIYAYNLPRRFNEDLLKGCETLMKWVDMCPYMSNLGLGLKIDDEESKRKNWYATNQFSLEVIFHNTMKHYKCLTNDSTMASAIYVPYYAGLDVGKYLWGDYNVSIRDESPKELMKFLSQQPQWKTMWGRDHFMIGGRIGWDFRRQTEENQDWGTKLMLLPEARNMSMLLIESGGENTNDFAIPYPTYFHPSKDNEIFEWQEKIRRMKRPHLFSFAGGPRPNSIRNDLIQHCNSSRRCKLVGCDKDNQCNDPLHVMKVFESSVFCLQPQGDSYTRRSTFDSMVAGCIPVFFHPESAYKQYLWHFPKNGSSYSVYIPESDVSEKRVMINETLARVSKSKVLAMRNEVIRLIPRIIYRYPSSRLDKFEDAFDIAVKGILGRIEAIAREMFTNVTNDTDG